MDTQSTQETITIIDSDEKEPIIYGDVLNLYANREKNAASIAEPNDPLVSIYFQAYNHLEDYTKPALDARVAEAGADAARACCTAAASGTAKPSRAGSQPLACTKAAKAWLLRMVVSQVRL